MVKRLVILLGFGVTLLFAIGNSDEDVYQDIPSLFFTDCLVSINKYRKDHGSLPLKWDIDLHYHAQAWADRLAAGDTVENDIETIDKLEQGQTVGYITPTKKRCRTYPPKDDCYPCRNVVQRWYNESKWYNYRTGYSRNRREQVLHFTQLVWLDTEKVGIATSVSPRYGVIVVARYYPRGNIGYLDDYIENVLPYGTEVPKETDGYEITSSGPEVPPECVKKKTKRSSAACFDTYPTQCRQYKEQNDGYCRYAKAFMSIYCRKTCEYCKVPLPAQETEEEKQLHLEWRAGPWSKRCRGGFQTRSMRCLHKHGRYEFFVGNDNCVKFVGRKPGIYRECDEKDEL